MVDVGTDLRVIFNERRNGPERLVCEAELAFETGILAGLKLHGFTLWRSAEGDIYPTVPSRTIGGGVDRRYFDLIRSQDGAGQVKRLKAWILSEYQRWVDAGKPAEIDRIT